MRDHLVGEQADRRQAVGIDRQPLDVIDAQVHDGAEAGPDVRRGSGEGQTLDHLGGDERGGGLRLVKVAARVGLPDTLR